MTEVRSFLGAHQRYGARPLTPQQCDEYVADTARTAAALGVLQPPVTNAELEERFRAFRSELSATPAARQAAHFLILRPPLPLAARPAYAALALAALELLPSWARTMLGFRLPCAIRAASPVAGHFVVRTVRWATRPDTPLRAADRPSGGG